jgi:hypothetical protein
MSKPRKTCLDAGLPRQAPNEFTHDSGIVLHGPRSRDAHHRQVLDVLGKQDGTAVERKRFTKTYVRSSFE